MIFTIATGLAIFSVLSIVGTLVLISTGTIKV